MSFRVSLSIFFGFLAVGLGSYFTIHNGWYPVTIVDFRFVSASTLEKDYQAAIRYFANAFLTYGTADPRILEQESAQQEIRRAALEKIIVDAIILKEARAQFGNDLDTTVENLIVENIDMDKITEAAEALYGLTFEEFKERILNAQARRELLEKRMFTEPADFQVWLKTASQNAKVLILVPGLKWNGEQVEAKSS